SMSDQRILALDIGSSSVRAIVFDARGNEAVGSHGEAIEVQLKYTQQTTSDGGVEMDADRLLALTVQCLRQVLRRAGTGRTKIAGVGISCFWHSLMGVDGAGRAVTPIYSWADTRSAPYVRNLCARLDPAGYHARTGCELHPSFWPA